MKAAAWAIALAALLGCVGSPEVNPPGDGPVCVRGTYWTRGDHGDNFMHPGRACIECHTERRRGPVFTVAGTIFNAPHEADDCMGNAGDPRTGQKTWVEVVDQTGRPFVIEANVSGNFYTTHAFRFPLRAVRLVSPDGRFVEMSSPPPSGDCNSCHSRQGTNDAPGRLVAPDRQM